MTPHVLVWLPEITVTVFVPELEYEVLKFAPLPVAGVPPPLQEYVPVPPVAANDASSPTLTVWVEGEQVSSGGGGVFTVTLQVLLSDPEVTVTVFVPAVENEELKFAPEPEAGEPGELHAYVPVPPVAEKDALLPTLTV